PLGSPPPGEIAVLSDLSDRVLRQRAGGEGLGLVIGPYQVRLKTRAPSLLRSLRLLYNDAPLSDDAFHDFHIDIAAPRGWLRPWRRQAVFGLDGLSTFEPLPEAHAPILFEWALNWCIATLAHDHVILHSAVLEKDGRAALLPAPPGSGKSTLCAGMVAAGWRLLSDEMALIGVTDGLLSPIPRPVSLKNASIEVIRARAPQATFAPSIPGTPKGTIGLMRPPREAIARRTHRVAPAWILFPRWQAGAPLALTPRPMASATFDVLRNCYNLAVHGQAGFDRLADVVGGCACFDLTYGDLDEALERLAALAVAR
ncbi:HprK-related kinase A, partial [Rhodospirillum rubrum]|uniref:HprK-related kinase A n=1 Tax=Rhodospirillum rubrum TaxID=1085 RepID=UPI001F5B3D29